MDNPNIMNTNTNKPGEHKSPDVCISFSRAASNSIGVNVAFIVKRNQANSELINVSKGNVIANTYLLADNKMVRKNSIIVTTDHWKTIINISLTVPTGMVRKSAEVKQMPKNKVATKEKI